MKEKTNRLMPVHIRNKLRCTRAQLTAYFTLLRKIEPID